MSESDSYPDRTAEKSRNTYEKKITVCLDEGEDASLQQAT